MKITVIGASAGIGLEVTRLALQKGHEVTTLSRRVVPLPDQSNLRRVQGSATNPHEVRTAVEGADAILVTLGVKSPLLPLCISLRASLASNITRDRFFRNPPGTHRVRYRRQLEL